MEVLAAPFARLHREVVLVGGQISHDFQLVGDRLVRSVLLVLRFFADLCIRVVELLYALPQLFALLPRDLGLLSYLVDDNGWCLASVLFIEALEVVVHGVLFRLVIMDVALVCRLHTRGFFVVSFTVDYETGLL